MAMYYLAEGSNLTASAYVTASSAATSYPVANLATTPVAKPWRSQGCSSEYILIDHGSAKSVSIIGIVGHNLSSVATITFSAGSTSACSDYSTTIPWATRTTGKVITAVSYRYNKISIQNPTNPYGFIQIGLLMLGAYSTFAFSPLLGSTVAQRYINLEQITDGGAILVRRLYRANELTLRFDGLTATQATQLQTLIDDASKNYYGILLIPNSADLAKLYFGRIADDVEWSIGYYRACQLRFVEDGVGFIAT